MLKEIYLYIFYVLAEKETVSPRKSNDTGPDNEERPLHDAVEANDASKLEGLISNNINNINKEDKYGQTPVLLATLHGYKECLSLLLKAGATCDSKDIAGAAPLHYAIKLERVKCIEELLKYKVNTSTKFRRTPPGHLTLSSGKIFDDVPESLKLLVDADDKDVSLKVNDDCQRNTFGESLLHLAVHKRIHKCIKFLCEKGADIEARENDLQNTPLHYAAYKGDEEALDIMLKEKQSSVDVSNKKDKTPLIIAVRSNHYAAAECLLKEYRANPNSVDHLNRTPLSCALKHGNSMMQVLINSGAKLNGVRVNQKYIIPAEMAVENDYSEALKVLHKNGANLETAGSQPSYLQLAAKHDSPKCITFLLGIETPSLPPPERVVDKNKKVQGDKKREEKYDNKTPMEVAIASGSYSAVQSILDYHVKSSEDDPNAVHFDYSCLYRIGKSWPETEVIHILNHAFPSSRVLKHPLITSFLKLKSNKMQFLHFAQLVYIFATLSLVFTYLYYYNQCLFSETFTKSKTSVTVKYSNTTGEVSIMNLNTSCLKQNSEGFNKDTLLWWQRPLNDLNLPEECFNKSSVVDENNGITDDTAPACAKSEGFWHKGFWWILMVFFVPVSLFAEIVQFRDSWKRYLASFQNFLDILIVFTVILCTPYAVDKLYEAQKCLAVLTMMSCGVYFMVIFGFIFRWWKVEVMIFCIVLQKSVILLIPYCLLLICFCLVFDSIFSGTEGFTYTGSSFIMAMTFMLGNYDKKIGNFGKGIVNDYIITVMTTAFIILVVIVLLNVFTGIAVNVSDDFRKEALHNISWNTLNYLHPLEVMASHIKYYKDGHIKSIKHKFSLAPHIYAMKLTNLSYEAQQKEIAPRLNWNNELVCWFRRQQFNLGYFEKHKGGMEIIKKDKVLKISQLYFELDIDEAESINKIKEERNETTEKCNCKNNTDLVAELMEQITRLAQND